MAQLFGSCLLFDGQRHSNGKQFVNERNLELFWSNAVQDLQNKNRFNLAEGIRHL
jgi:hypothetical protein